jgi:hypothetical protein
MNAVERLVAHFEEADVETEQLGGRWYRESQRVARRLSRKHGTTIACAAGVIAALSPRIRWASNVALADAVLAGHEVTGVFGRNLEKARRIAAGERPLTVLGGDKVRAFYRAIMGDEDSVVIDVWMCRAVGVHKVALSSRGYEAIADAVREAAKLVGVTPAQLQAIVWVQVRGGAT